jgi:hypothetical protein
MRYRFDARVRVPVTIVALLVVGGLTIVAILLRNVQTGLYGGIATVAIGADLWRQAFGAPPPIAWRVVSRVAASFLIVGATWYETRSMRALLVSLGLVAFANAMFVVFQRRHSLRRELDP